MTEDPLLQQIAAKKAELDWLRPLAPHAFDNLNHAQDIELTYGSNAIEGNTLTAVETMMVVEQGITIAGKSLKDHMEALDHYEAIGYVRALARESAPFTEMDVRNLHHIVMQRTDPAIAGQYANQQRRTPTDDGNHIYPSPAEIPALMGDFAQWLARAPVAPETAFTAHRRLVEIHPFNDGNGRTARLLMNLILLRGGFPAIPLRPQDRPAYISALQDAQSGRGTAAFDRLHYERLDSTLGESLSALQEALTAPKTPAPTKPKTDKPAP